MSDINTVTHSINLDDLSLEQLVQLSQGFGHQIEDLRAKRAYLRAKIDQRLDRGERTSLELAEPVAEGDAAAPGATIDVGVSQG